jgi:AcrR family transcriptional regulator
VFAELGPEAALDEVARRAEIGNSTVYRHFPDRAALLYEVVVAVMTRTAEEAERARAEESDPFAAVCRLVHAAAKERIAVLCPLLAGYPTDRGAELAEQKERLIDAGQALVARAQHEGGLRADVTFSDILMSLAQLTRPLAGVAWAAADRFAGRDLQVYLDGLHTPVRSNLPGTAATLEDLRRRAQ